MKQSIHHNYQFKIQVEVPLHYQSTQCQTLLSLPLPLYKLLKSNWTALPGYHDETKHNNASLFPIYLGQPTLQNDQVVDIPLHPHPTTSFLQSQSSPSPVTLHQPTGTRDPLVNNNLNTQRNHQRPRRLPNRFATLAEDDDDNLSLYLDVFVDDFLCLGTSCDIITWFQKNKLNYNH